MKSKKILIILLSIILAFLIVAYLAISISNIFQDIAQRNEKNAELKKLNDKLRTFEVTSEIQKDYKEGRFKDAINKYRQELSRQPYRFKLIKKNAQKKFKEKWEKTNNMNALEKLKTEIRDDLWKKESEIEEIVKSSNNRLMESINEQKESNEETRKSILNQFKSNDKEYNELQEAIYELYLAQANFDVASKKKLSARFDLGDKVENLKEVCGEKKIELDNKLKKFESENPKLLELQEKIDLKWLELKKQIENELPKKIAEREQNIRNITEQLSSFEENYKKDDFVITKKIEEEARWKTKFFFYNIYLLKSSIEKEKDWNNSLSESDAQVNKIFNQSKNTTEPQSKEVTEELTNALNERAKSEENAKEYSKRSIQKKNDLIGMKFNNDEIELYLGKITPGIENYIKLYGTQGYKNECFKSPHEKMSENTYESDETVKEIKKRISEEIKSNIESSCKEEAKKDLEWNKESKERNKRNFEKQLKLFTKFNKLNDELKSLEEQKASIEKTIQDYEDRFENPEEEINLEIKSLLEKKGIPERDNLINEINKIKIKNNKEILSDSLSLKSLRGVVFKTHKKY